jgi:hypothetical protein
VWYGEIYKESDSETSKYITGSNGDFNIALENLFSDSSTQSKIAKIEGNQNTVALLMKKLLNPPKGLENCYSTITDLYTAYKGLTDLAIDPNGSLNSFTGEKNEKVDSFLQFYNKLEAQIPNKK